MTQAALGNRPWIEIDGPSLSRAAAALQLLPENIHCLARLQRLAAIGVALPSRPEVQRLSPSRLRALLKDQLISNDAVLANEDPYDDIYVLEIPFHGGPRLVAQGMTSQSAQAVNLLLHSILGPNGESLPNEYRTQVELLARVLLTLSDTICRSAGLQRGNAPSDRIKRDVFVPGQTKLNQLGNAVYFTWATLSELLPASAIPVIDELSVMPGQLSLMLGNAGDDQIIVAPLLLTEDGVVVANPGELAAALRHRIVALSLEHDCRSQLAEAFRAQTLAEARDLLKLCGASTLKPVSTHPSRALLRQRFLMANDKTIDVIVVTDEFAGYALDEPFGVWETHDLALAIEAWLNDEEEAPPDSMNALQLILTGGVGRVMHLGFQGRADNGPRTVMRLDELRVMAELDGNDPLFLWYFAAAEEEFRSRTRIMAWNTLDLYAIYRGHDYSFYLEDTGAPDLLSVASDTALPLRIEAMQRVDRHVVPSPYDPVFVEVGARYGTDIAPIYFRLDFEHSDDLLIEVDQVDVWVLHSRTHIAVVDDFISILIDASAYWIWQIGCSFPSLLAAASTDSRLYVELAVDDPGEWSRFHEGARAGDSSTSWLELVWTDAGRLQLKLKVDGADALFADNNHVDRTLLTELLRVLISASDRRDINISAAVDELAPLGRKRMMRFTKTTDIALRPGNLPAARGIQQATMASILDGLGTWLTENGLEPGQVPSEDRTKVLGKAVGHYFTILTEAVAELSPDGLLDQLLTRDEARRHEDAVNRDTLPSRIACFGESGSTTKDLTRKRRRSVVSAIASRFLIEYVAAKPPTGTKQLTLSRYDYLLALTDELASRGTLSDAIHHGFSEAQLSILESGRLGVSRGDRYEAGTDALLEAQNDALRAVALGPVLTAPKPSPEAPSSTVEAAMRAEFGFTFEEMALGVGELIAYAESRGTIEPCRALLSEVRARLASVLSWSVDLVDAFLKALILCAREDFFSVGRVETYPWRFNRKYSYLRRPLILVESSGGEQTLVWGIRALWDASSYWVNLVYSGRLYAVSPQMKRVVNTVRQAQNKEFEREVALALGNGGCSVTVHSIAKFSGRKLESSNRDDLGDIDALGINIAKRLVFVAEAKDFEIARTPAEMANEADALLRGEKSASLKTARRAQWVRDNIQLVLTHFGLGDHAGGWTVEPLIVTSRDLISPRVLKGDIPVMSIDRAETWISRRILNHRISERRKRR